MRLTVRQEQALRSAVHMVPPTRSGAQDAALALREVMPAQLQANSALSSSGGETPDKAAAFGVHRTGLHFGSSYSPRSMSSHCTCFQADGSGTGGTAIALDNQFVPLVQRLLNDQSMLRDSFEDTKRRLRLLEGMRYLPEVKRLPQSTEVGMDSADADAHSSEKPWLSLQQHDSDAPVPPPQMHDGQATSQAAAMSPASALTATLRRSEEDRRSAALSGENELLRQELAEATELSEALERQQQAAEDRVRLLEQEHAWLAAQLVQLAIEPGSVSATGGQPNSANETAADCERVPLANTLTCSIALPSVAEAGKDFRNNSPETGAADRCSAEEGTALSIHAQDFEHRLLEAEARTEQLEVANSQLLTTSVLQSTSALLESADSLGPFAGVQLPTPAAEPVAVELTHDEDSELDEVY